MCGSLWHKTKTIPGCRESEAAFGKGIMERECLHLLRLEHSSERTCGLRIEHGKITSDR